MKNMILTGLATEQTFDNPEPACFLLFNGGSLRVPISQEAAEIVIREMYGTAPKEEVEDTFEPSNEPPYEDDDDNSSFYQDTDEAGIGQI